MMSSLLPMILAQAPRASRSGAPVGLILSMILAAAVIVLFVSFAKRYKRCPSNRILVIYGKTNQGAARCIHGDTCRWTWLSSR